MNIAVVVTDLKIGGAELMLLRLLERLDKRKFSLHVISLGMSGDLEPHIGQLGIPVTGIGMRSGRLNLAQFSRLVGVLKAIKPDLIQTWMYHGDVLGGLAAMFARLDPVVWGVRNGALDRTSAPLRTRALVRFCAILSRWIPTRILTCSEAARQIHVRLGYPADRFVVIPNGFDLARLRPDSAARESVRAELGVLGNTPLIGSVGRFHPQKNHQGFIEAAALLHVQRPQARFVMVGEGIDSGNQRLRDSIDAAGISEVTSLLGLRRDIPRLMAAFDVLVSSSVYGEAFPNVVGEAMACGVPCVVTNVGDSARIVGDCGRVVATDDAVASCAAISEILGLSVAERRSLAERARARMVEEFELGDVVRRYEAFYLRLAATAGAVA